MKTAFITDSGSGKSIDEMASLGIFSLPLQISVDDKNYFDIEQISNAAILSAIKEGKNLSTSLPSLGLIDSLFTKIKEEGFDRIIAVPICSGLSGTMNTLFMLANEYDIPINCIETYVTACVQEYLIKYLAKAINEDGLSKEEAIANAKKVVDSCDTLLIPNDIKYLSRSGRLTKTAANVATLLGIKPILSISKKSEGKIDVLAKVRTFKKAMDKAIDIIASDIDEDYVIYIAHVDAYADAMLMKEKMMARFPKNKIEVLPLCSPIAIHTGLGCIGIQYFKPIK